MNTSFEPKRILMTADAVGGVWQYSLDLVRELTRNGHEVLLAVLGPEPSPEQRSAFAAIGRAHLTTAAYALEWMNDPWDDVDRSRAWLLGLERDFRPAVVQVNGYALADAPWLAPVVTVAHSCVVSWWLAVHRSLPSPEWNEYVVRVRRGLHASTAIVAPSQFMADSLTGHYGIARETITTIPNFSSAPLAPADAGKQAFFLTAGRVWDVAKNTAVLESIAPHLVWPLAIAGSTDSNREASAASCVRHLGRLPHATLLAEMARAAVFVHPAVYEPFGLAVLEAARARCALVLADIPSLRELWDGAALFVEPHDKQSWLAALNELAGNSAQINDIASRAFERAGRYTADSSVPRYLDLYERAAQGKTGRTGAAA